MRQSSSERTKPNAATKIAMANNAPRSSKRRNDDEDRDQEKNLAESSTNTTATAARSPARPVSSGRSHVVLAFVPTPQPHPTTAGSQNIASRSAPLATENTAPA